jgi:hypothetical protein
VAGAATKVTKAYTESSAAGATFGGSMQNFSRAASTAGMTMDNFSRMIAQNGEALTAFGSTTDSGANRFATVSKELRNSSGGLYALGYTTEEINQGLANYGKTIKMQGRQGTMTNAELVAGSKKYLQEMDLLAKVTGESRKQQEDARAKLLLDAQVQSKISSMTKEDGEAFMNTINGLPPGLRDVAKDIMVTGTATTEESRNFSALMPQSAEMMRKFAQITEGGGKVTAEMQQELQNLMAQEGKQKKAEMRSVGMYNKELAGTYGQINMAAGMNKDALTDAQKAQLKAQEETDAMNKRMQEAQQTLAKFSNGFQMALVNSGLLDLLMKTFGMVATFVQTSVVPGFFLLAGIVTTIGGILINTLQPAFEGMGNFIADKVYPAFQELAAFFVAYVIPGVTEAINNLLPIFVAVGEAILPPLISIGEFIFDNLTPILVGLGIGMAAFAAAKAVSTAIILANAAATSVQTLGVLGAIAGFLGLNVAMLPFLAIALAVTAGLVGLALLFKHFGGDLQVVGDGFKWLWSYLEEFGQNLVLLFYKIMDKITPGDKYKDLAEEQAEKIKKTTDEREALEKGMADRMKANREKAAEKEQKAADTKNALDIKNIKEGQKNAAGLEANNKKQAEEQEKKLNLNANENDLLLDFAKQQGSAYIKDKPATTNVAETNKASMVAESQATKEGAIKKAEEEQKKTEEAKKGNPAVGAGTPTQESPASLLASLNTKMDQLIKFTAQTTTNTYEQIGAVKGLSGNLFKM